LFRLVLLAFAVFISNLGAVSAAPLSRAQAVSALEQVAHAGRNLDYQGVFVIQRGENVETCRITHLGSGPVEREKVERLDGAPLEIVRVESDVLVYVPRERFVKSRTGVVERSFPAMTGEQIATIGELYEVHVGGKERIAGRFATHLTLLPKDNHRHRHEMWIDQRTALQLKAQMFDDRGQLIEQVMFTELSFNEPITRSMVESVYAEEALAWRMDKGARQRLGASASSHWEAVATPPGFKKVMEVSKGRGKKGHRVHLVYSDGLSAVSVFIESRKKRGFESGLKKEGPLNVYRRVIEDQFVTVIGDVPADTIQLIGDSLVKK